MLAKDCRISSCVLTERYNVASRVTATYVIIIIHVCCLSTMHTLIASDVQRYALMNDTRRVSMTTPFYDLNRKMQMLSSLPYTHMYVFLGHLIFNNYLEKDLQQMGRNRSGCCRTL